MLTKSSYRPKAVAVILKNLIDATIGEGLFAVDTGLVITTEKLQPKSVICIEAKAGTLNFGKFSVLGIGVKGVSYTVVQTFVN